MKKTGSRSSNLCGLFPLHQRLECFLESWSSTHGQFNWNKWSANGCPCPLSLTSTSRQEHEPCHSRHSRACLICVGFGAWNNRDQTSRRFKCILKIRCTLHLPQTCAISFVPTCMDLCGHVRPIILYIPLYRCLYMKRFYIAAGTFIYIYKYRHAYYQLTCSNNRCIGVWYCLSAFQTRLHNSASLQLAQSAP